MGFKEDADFARFVSMGATATDAVRRDLHAAGHEPIELERYAMANKVWQTKVKRLRLPDLVCIRCGLRIESRGKSQLGIILSHSDAEGRAWDGGGMRDDDLYAFLRIDISVSPPRTSRPAYFYTKDLRAARHLAKESSRKAISEGAEVTLTWPSWVPGYSGTYIATDLNGRLVCDWDTGKRYKYHHWNKWKSQYLYVQPDQEIVADETIVAGVVAPPDIVSCGGYWDLAAALHSTDPTERYAAIKAAGVSDDDRWHYLLTQMTESEEDWRLRLEALGSLARLQPAWTEQISEMATSDDNPEQQRMESVFVLSEIETDEAAEALVEVARPASSKPSELRAAAVWGAARGVKPRPELVLPYAVDDDELVALHAIAGMPWLTDGTIRELKDWLGQDDRHAAAAAQLLLRHRAIRPLLEVARGEGRGRLWALRALGDIPRTAIKEEAPDLLSAQTERELEPIWIAQDDWLRGPASEGLDALDVQKVRFSPLP